MQHSGYVFLQLQRSKPGAIAQDPCSGWICPAVDTLPRDHYALVSTAGHVW